MKKKKKSEKENATTIAPVHDLQKITGTPGPGIPILIKRLNPLHPRDVAYLYFEAMVEPGERTTLRPIRAERVRAQVGRRDLTEYAAPEEVPAASIAPFKPGDFTFLHLKAEGLIDWDKLRLTSLQTGDVENIASPYLADGLPVEALLHVTAFGCRSAAEVSLGIWNAGDTPVLFSVRCTGPTMPEGGER